MKTIRKNSIISLIMFAFTFLTGCGGVYESSKDGYTAVTNIDAVSFEVSSAWASAATAISNIRDTEEYNGLFVKKTEDTYILFDMSEILVVCSRSQYDFNGNETVETLEAHDINNVWLKPTDKKLEYDKSKKGGAYKIIAEATADYSVTPTQYASFTGKMASVSDESEEWSLFVGAMTTSLSSSQEKIIDHVVKSFKFNEERKGSEAPATEEENIPEKAKDVAVGPEVSEANNAGEVNQEEAEVVEDAQPEELPATEESSEEEITSEIEEVELVIEEEQEEVSEDNAATEESETSSEETETYIKPRTKVGVSTTYVPFDLGDTADCDVLSSKKEFTRTQITLEEIITGQDAIDFIKKNGGKKTEPSVGTTFVVAKYSSSIIDPRDVYIDLKFLGVDGENLKYLGVEYPSKAYDIYTKIQKDGKGCTDIYAYYEVPIGAKEYLLKFGMKAWEDNGSYEDIRTANFLITVD